MNPWLKRKRKLKQFVAMQLMEGLTWRQFFGIDSPGFFRSQLAVRSETPSSSGAVVVLPQPKTVAMPKMSLKSESMVEAMTHVDFTPVEEDDADQIRATADDKLDASMVTLFHDIAHAALSM